MNRLKNIASVCLSLLAALHGSAEDNAVAGWKQSAQNPVPGGKLGTCFDISAWKAGEKSSRYFSWQPKKSIALVESDDGGSRWERLADNPVIRPGDHRWDHDARYQPSIIGNGRRWLLWYNGRHASVEQIGLAIHEGEDLGF